MTDPFGLGYSDFLEVVEEVKREMLPEDKRSDDASRRALRRLWRAWSRPEAEVVDWILAAAAELAGPYKTPFPCPRVGARFPE